MFDRSVRLAAWLRGWQNNFRETEDGEILAAEYWDLFSVLCYKVGIDEVKAIKAAAKQKVTETDFYSL